MPNSFFRFKQFVVHQERCAMKVCTDACLFGSLLPTSCNGEGVKHVLDIGAGTGLLSLMYAQKNPDAIIDAVEIDKAAAIQARENFEASPWNERLNVYHCSIQQLDNSMDHQYDLIISNPPFFENDLKSDDAKRNLALHSSELSLEELLTAVNKHLTEEGCFAVLLPYRRNDYFAQLATGHGYFLREKILVKQTPQHNYFRSILLFSRQPANTVQKEIIVTAKEGAYTPEFTTLLKDYYLNL